MADQKKPTKHSQASQRFNDDLINYIIESVYYPNDLSTGGGMMNTSDFSALIGDAKTHREARNRILFELKKNPELLSQAISDFNDDFGDPDKGVVYNDKSFDAKRSKMEPILPSQMSIQDINEMAQRVALALGYKDNGVDQGARKSMLDNLYVGDGGALKSWQDAHPIDYQFYKNGEILAQKLRERLKTEKEVGDFLRTLGFNPSSSLDEVLDMENGIPSYVDRSYRAYARNRNIPLKVMNVAESFAFPQNSTALNEGRNPSFIDASTDVLEGMLFGAGKTGKAITGGLWGPMKSAIVEGGLDFGHDLADEMTKEYIYSQGDYPIKGQGDPSNVLDPSRLATLGYLLGMGGVGSMTRAVRGARRGRAQSSEYEVPESVGKAEVNSTKAKIHLEKADEIARDINLERKRRGMKPIDTEQFKKTLAKELERKQKTLEEERFNERLKKSASALFGGLSRVAGTRARFGTPAQLLYQNYDEIVKGKE